MDIRGYYIALPLEECAEVLCASFVVVLCISIVSACLAVDVFLVVVVLVAVVVVWRISSVEKLNMSIHLELIKAK